MISECVVGNEQVEPLMPLMRICLDWVSRGYEYAWWLNGWISGRVDK